MPCVSLLRGRVGESMGKRLPEADPRRIARFLRKVGEVGRDPRGGWSRLASSQEERQVHAVFERWATDLGLSVCTDPIGNTFAELSHDNNSAPALMSGSHLDTVPQGGGFDGSAGVAAALEVARLLSEAGGLSRPYRAVVFSGEEGARFGAPCIGSRSPRAISPLRRCTSCLIARGAPQQRVLRGSACVRQMLPKPSGREIQLRRSWNCI